MSYELPDIREFGAAYTKKHPVPKHQSAIDNSNSITLKVDEIDNSNANIEQFHEGSAAEDEEH